MKLKDSLPIFGLVSITIIASLIFSVSANDDNHFTSSSLIDENNKNNSINLNLKENSFDKSSVVDVTKNFSNLIRIGDILDLFSISKIGALWSVIEPQLSISCSNNMMVYFRGLENEKMWALKSKSRFFFC
jgi:hypothetical protein